MFFGKKIPPQDRVLNWKPNHDPRSRNFPMTAILPTTASTRTRRMWKQGRVLDQGKEGACVGFGWTAEALAAPFAPRIQPPKILAERRAHEVYNRAKLIDEWPGEDYSGTSVLAGAKVMQSLGRISEYRWCFGIDDVRETVLSHGPVVLGIPWYDSMYTVMSGGLVVVGGRKVGGHCITITGYDKNMDIYGSTREVFRWRNSWGKSYGYRGSAFIEFDVLAKLLDEGGEACAPTKMKVPII